MEISLRFLIPIAIPLFDRPSMDIRRLLLTILTVLCVSVTGLSLVGSLNETQIQSRLELYQTNLLLRTVGLDGDRVTAPTEMDLSANTIGQAIRAGFGQGDVFNQALKSYQTFRDTAQGTLDKLNARLDDPSSIVTPDELFALQAEIRQQTQTIAEVDLRIGLLYAFQDKLDNAQKQWQPLIPDGFDFAATVQSPTIQTPTAPTQAQIPQTAGILSELWSTPTPTLNTITTVPPQLQTLDGWFSDVAIARWFELTNQTEPLAELRDNASDRANRTALKLSTVNLVPIVGLLIGSGLLIYLLIQRFTKKGKALLALNNTPAWDIPWSDDTTLQVFVVGFFFAGQLIVPIVLAGGLGFAGINPAALTGLPKASYILLGYGLLSIAGLWVLRYSIREHWPLAKSWFNYTLRDRWLSWGIGGYAIALPLVVGVSLVNQYLWQGQGGSNPILSIILENRDPWAIAAFFITASLAAPLFEETLFRGFLLPSLTRHLSPWGAVIVSALIFAIAHLSLSEVLPLTVLGIVLGGVYLRTRNLLAPILLHGLWNSGTLISLLVLSNGGI